MFVSMPYFEMYKKKKTSVMHVQRCCFANLNLFISTVVIAVAVIFAWAPCCLKDYPPPLASVFLIQKILAHTVHSSRGKSSVAAIIPNNTKSTIILRSWLTGSLLFFRQSLLK